MKISSFFLILIFASLSVLSQERFYIKSSIPPDGTYGLPSEPDSVLFQLIFSRDVFTYPDGRSPFSGYNRIPFLGIIISPEDSIRSVRILQTDTLEDTVKFYMKLAPNTDYSMIVTGATDSAGKMLDSIFVLNFSTSLTPGNRVISGTVEVPGSFEKIAFMNLLKSSQFEPAKGMALLLDQNPFTTPNANIIYASRIASDYSFRFTNVRDGLYFLLAGFDSNNDGIFEPIAGDALFFYDADNNGFPDPLNVSGDILNLNITSSFNLFTARSNLDSAVKLALSYAGDARLKGIRAFELPGPGGDPIVDGKFVYVEYIFKSASRGYFSYVFTLFQNPARVDTPEFKPTIDIPAEFIDSDSVSKIVERNGGADFKAQFETILAQYLLMNFSGVKDISFLPPDTSSVYWGVIYFGFASDTANSQLPFGSFVIFIDPVTGDVVKKFTYLPIPVTAQEKYQQIDSLAKLYASDAKLMFVSGFINPPIDTTGRTPSWIYGYNSQSKGRFNILLFGIPSIDTSDTMFTIPVNLALEPLWNYLDSDSIMSIAEDNGGREFRIQNPDAGVMLYLGQSLFYKPDRIYWHATYIKIDSITQDTIKHIVIIDPKTGQVDTVITGVEYAKSAEIPESFKLYQNYPNPFNPSTTIEFELPEETHVRVSVYDILGRKLKVLIDRRMEPGRYKIKLDMKGFPSGVYFYRMETEKFFDIKKMILIK
jgi:hypothetical protein